MFIQNFRIEKLKYIIVLTRIKKKYVISLKNLALRGLI